ncbi:hemolysin BL-binding protein, partial [Pantoea sp. Bo_2]|uniref:VENN motif pre-toxin domain-containing protein n=1 Tax=unclassified Pantoea TaxID=2630326 RepID=UPI0012319D4F
ANVNVSRDRMHSNWQSVTEQTGIFAGQGGFDVTVGEHTQLNGAVIGSTATAGKNRLDTGTLGFSDIENHADYKVEHQSAGISSGGSIGGEFAGNMANGMLAGLNGSGSASSVTKSAVSEGTIIIRYPSKQVQDVAELSRDAENANPGLEVIFDKEKEQNRLKAAQLIGEIGAQAGDIARTQGQIAGLKAQQDPSALAAAREELAGKGKLNPTSDEIAKQAYDTAMKPFGTGSALQQGISAVTAAVQGLSGGNVAQALSGAASPYLATEIHKLTEGSPEAQAMAHAVLGAVTSYASGNSALAGAAGGVSGELMAKLVMNQLYPGKAVSELTESEKQTISALGTLAAGLAGGVVGGSTADAVAGAQAGQNALENNALSDIAQAQSEGKTPEQKAGKYVEAENERYKEVNCGGMSAEACSVKMYTERREALKDMASLGTDFVPVVGDIKSFAEAQSALDYLVAAIGIIPGAGDAAGKAIKAAQTALAKGDVAEASKLLNKASDEISGYLPSPGQTSLPSSGIGSNAAFSVNNAQLGKKLGKHVEDFGGNASNAADRQRVLDIINDIGSHPDKVIAGKFAGQGTDVGASRGNVFFRIKGNNVVVTKPDGSFVTILKDGINNTSVKNALKGDPK